MWIIILSTCVIISLVMSLAFCLCWKKKNHKEEWLGLDGMVIQKNPDENVNHLPSAASCVVDGINASGDSLNNKRNVVTNTRRSLPDIPSEQDPTVTWEPSVDNSSEHYATVGHYQNSAKRPTVPNGIESRPSISQHSSISQADDTPYERVKYDKIKSKEHPYAQLQPTVSRPIVYEENHASVDERITLLRNDGASSSNELTAPPRSRRSSAHSNVNLEIPAASAVAGGIAASPELPYMTPPVTQANFSGDSQDSSKGYTSISVREPLANIIAQTKEMNKSKRQLDPHYSTVSDDSDDVYTTIPDPNNPIYTSESETYARIPPHPITVEAEVNQPPNQMEKEEELDEAVDELYEPPPQPTPPSVDSLKQVTGHSFSHSRQASSSSSIANVGSPKPEKRQANSPLPPPPAGSSFDFHADKVQIMRNLDDLYAKVHKNKKEDHNNGEKTPEKPLSYHGESVRNSITSSKSLFEEKTPEKRKEHNYETLKKSPRKMSDPGYEKIRGCDEPGYASINGPESLASSSDPGYEVLKNRTPSECDPNYEQLRHRTSNASDCGYSRIKENVSNDGYSVVNKRKSHAPLTTLNSEDNSADEPNYESMPSEVNGSDTDPNYESVSQSDPNYESVKDLEPPYERLDDDSSKTNSDISGYEKVNKNSDSSTSGGKTDTEPPYEQLNNNSDLDVPGYEKISKGNQNSSSSGSSVEPIQNEVVTDVSSRIHEEDAIFHI